MQFGAGNNPREKLQLVGSPGTTSLAALYNVGTETHRTLD